MSGQVFISYDMFFDFLVFAGCSSRSLGQCFSNDSVVGGGDLAKKSGRR